MVESSESGFYLAIDYAILFPAFTISLHLNEFWIGIQAVKVSSASAVCPAVIVDVTAAVLVAVVVFYFI